MSATPTPVPNPPSIFERAARKLGTAAVLLSGGEQPIPGAPDLTAFPEAPTLNLLAGQQATEAQKVREAQEQEAKLKAAQTSKEETANKISNFQFETLSDIHDTLGEIKKLDLSTPQGRDTAQALYKKLDVLNEAYSHKTTPYRERWPTNPLQIKAAAAVGWNGPIDQMPPEKAEQYESELIKFALAEKTSTTSGIDPETQLPFSRTTTTKTSIPGVANPPDTSHLGKGGVKTSPPSAPPKPSPAIESAYKAWTEYGVQPKGKMFTPVVTYAMQNGKPLPIKPTKLLTDELKQVNDMEKGYDIMKDAADRANEAESGGQGQNAGVLDSNLAHRFLSLTFGGGKISRPSQTMQQQYVNAKSWAEKIQVLPETAIHGSLLSRGQRQAMLSVAQDAVNEERKEYERLKTGLGELQGTETKDETKKTGEVPGFIPIKK